MIAWANLRRDLNLTILRASIPSTMEKIFAARFHFDWFRLPERGRVVIPRAPLSRSLGFRETRGRRRIRNGIGGDYGKNDDQVDAFSQAMNWDRGHSQRAGEIGRLN